jgi:hypothetical protein
MFARLFGPPITRVELDWDQLQASASAVTVEVRDRGEELGGLFHPWYVSPAGKEAGWSDGDGFSEHRRRRVRQLAGEYQASKPPVQLLAGCYDIGEERRLVVDGNHRIAAVVESSVAFRLLALTVCGPLDESILPDLRHWP